MRKGFTLIELLVAVTLAGVLALTIGVALMAGATFSADANTRVELRRDSRYALMTVARAVRVKSQAEVLITQSGGRLTLDPSVGSPPYFEKQGSNLVYFDGTNTNTLIHGTVTSIAFALDAGPKTGAYLLSIALRLDNGNHSELMTVLVRLRN